MTDYTNDPRWEVAKDHLARRTPSSTPVDLLTALDAVDPARRWRPIGHAPKDGTEVVLYSKGRGKEVGFFEDGAWFGEDYVLTKPTHFLPLPAPPEAL